MTTRRNPGEGGLHWEEPRQRWFATVYVGYAPNGKRRKVKVSARTKTEAKAKLSSCSGIEPTGTCLVVRPTPFETLSSHGSRVASPDARSRPSSIGASWRARM